MENNEDVIITTAQDFIRINGPKKHGGPVQDLMDLVSGIVQYKMAACTPQGYIYNKLIHARLEYNHIIDRDQLISKFWSGVFKAITKAKIVGAIVDIDNGTDEAPRATRLTPLQYIRKHGVSAGRKYIDECCKKKLRQRCNDCHNISTLGPQREYDRGCLKCGCTESAQPRQFNRKRIRVCVMCSSVRTTRYERVCGRVSIENGVQIISNGCGSSDITLVQIEDPTDIIDDMCGVEHCDTPEDMLSEAQSSVELDRFTRMCIESLPNDIRDTFGDSNTKRVLRVLVDPACGAGVCNECIRVSPKIIKDDKEIPDPKYCCGARRFAIGSCINYSKRLGQYFGYSAALANRRVNKVRQHTLAIAKKYVGDFDVAKAIVQRLSA
jgi:hypothetical protein